MLSRSLGMPSRSNGPPSIGDTHGLSGNVFANPTASSSALYPQESNPWVSIVSHKAKHQLRIRDASQDRQPEIQSSFVREDVQRIMGQTNNDCRFQILISTKFSTSATFACWKIRFKTEVCTCSQISYGSYAVNQRSGDGWISGWS